MSFRYMVIGSEVLSPRPKAAVGVVGRRDSCDVADIGLRRIDPAQNRPRHGAAAGFWKFAAATAESPPSEPLAVTPLSSVSDMEQVLEAARRTPSVWWC